MLQWTPLLSTKIWASLRLQRNPSIKNSMLDLRGSLLSKVSCLRIGLKGEREVVDAERADNEEVEILKVENPRDLG